MRCTIISAALLSAACSDAGSVPIATPTRPAVVDIAPDDAEMDAAKRQGRATLPAFYRRLAAPAADESMFSVKYDLLPGPEAEFIWASVEQHTLGGVIARLGNEPEAKGYKLGQQVTVRDADIIDWQIRKGRTMEGHYTTRVLIDRMPAPEAAQYRAALGW